jgi:hypothetical protein
MKIILSLVILVTVFEMVAGDLHENGTRALTRFKKEEVL